HASGTPTSVGRNSSATPAGPTSASRGRHTCASSSTGWRQSTPTAAAGGNHPLEDAAPQRLGCEEWLTPAMTYEEVRARLLRKPKPSDRPPSRVPEAVRRGELLDLPSASQTRQVRAVGDLR